MNEVSYYKTSQIHPHKTKLEGAYDTLSIIKRTNARTMCFVVSGHLASVSWKERDTHLITVSCEMCYWRSGTKRNLFDKKAFMNCFPYLEVSEQCQLTIPSTLQFYADMEN
jgi:hypothetical protein